MFVKKIPIDFAAQKIDPEGALEEVSEFTFPNNGDWSAKAFEEMFDHLMVMCNWAYEAQLLQLSFALEGALDACLFERAKHYPNHLNGSAAQFAKTRKSDDDSSVYFYCNNNTWQFEIEDRPVVIVSM